MRRVAIASIIVLALLISLAACSSPMPTVNDGGSEGARPLRIVATTSIVADVVTQVAGEHASVTTLLPLGADPHAFAPSPRDLATLHEADAIMANGAGLEEFLEGYLASAGQDVPVIYLSEGITLRAFGEHDDEGEQPGDVHEDGDPHTWTSPLNVMVFARNAADALAALDPANAEAYHANADAYVAALEDLDRWIQAQIDTVPAENRVLVSDHDVFGYYADRYGLEQLGAIVPAFSSAAQPSARELADLQTAMRERGVQVVFVGTSANPNLAERVAADLGIQVVVLYTGSLGEAGSGAETYIDYMRYNTTAIVQALR
jgi:manganese/iron transport system substrate-binding protein